jgi:hypothetical protein
MKVGAASKLEEVSPEHFKQLCDQAKLGWPMVRERVGEICQKMLEAIRDPKALPELQNASVREIVTRRAERMLELLTKTKG